MRHKIKGDIISWNSSIWDFNQKMRSIKEDEDIELEINSYGGDVFLGIDLCNTLRAHKGKVTAIITGIAASAASVIVMGADEIKAYNNTQIMLHNAWTIAMGNSKELRKVADDLESINESVLASYTQRLDEKTAKKLLDDETYLSAKKAKEYGLVDEVLGEAVAEEVESEIFENKAKEFNNKIVAANNNRLIAASGSMDAESINQMLSELRNEIEQLKNSNQKELGQEPVKSRNLGKLFLNL
ncbi:Clp protease ClpP [Bacillus tianshenii]|nr:Clp protease ClpP [Bacillus tianshenii]